MRHQPSKQGSSGVFLQGLISAYIIPLQTKSSIKDIGRKNGENLGQIVETY